MNRSKLLQTLEVVGRALERNNVLPIYEYFCFTGETVFAFNDNFGIVSPCQVPKPFAVHGPRFRDFLQASKADEIEMEVDQDQLLFVLGKTPHVLPSKTSTDFVWTEPELESGSYDKYPDSEEGVITGIEHCLATCSENLALEAFARVYIGHVKNEHNTPQIAIYSTDGDALTKYMVGMVGQADVCLSRAFCDAVVKIGSTKNANSNILVGKEWVCRNFEDYKIYGRNLGPTTFDYETNIGKILGGTAFDLVGIPEKLKEDLTRARVVSDVETSATTITIKGNMLELQTETPFGNVYDEIKVKHPDIEVRVSAELLQKSMTDCTQFRILKNCCVFKGNKVLRLVSNL